MQIVKVFNNNVVLVLNDNIEMIVLGKGIGFQKKSGDLIDEKLIEKTFVLENQESINTLSTIYKELTPEETEVVFLIIKEAEKVIKYTFESTLYITLADHIHYAIERTKQGLFLKNPLTWEVRKFYPVEFQMGKKAIDIIKTKLDVALYEDEAASIALHFVNAQKDGHLLEHTMNITKIVQDILAIVRLHYGKQMDEESVIYNRFVTHLQYFAQRVDGGIIQGTNDSFLYEQVSKNYPIAFACTQKIKQYVEETYRFAMGRDEQVYLAIHIQRLFDK